MKIMDYLGNQPVYGVKRARGKEWYLSAIMFFFRFDRRWLHTINGSYWKKVDSKEDMIEGLIEKYEQELNG